MGRLLAVELARQGHQVAIHDAGSPAAEGSAATVAAAMLAPLAESAITEPGVVRMGHHALTRWPQLLAPLAEPANNPLGIPGDDALRWGGTGKRRPRPLQPPEN